MLIAEFGSKHNGVRDVNSDRDLLVVGENWKEINSTSERFKNYGYSVSSFNIKKAIYLSEHGSLFFKHIINECMVINDDNSSLKVIGNAWKPKDSYANEIESNLDLLELLKYTPKTIHSYNFINDLLIISIRSILIRKIAEYGEYVFSWEVIFSKAIKLSLLRERDVQLLRRAKKLKNAYRVSIYYKITESFISELLAISCRVFNHKVKIGRDNEKQLLSSPETYEYNSYKQLRALEFLCSHYSFDRSLSKYIELTRNPNYTCATKALISCSR